MNLSSKLLRICTGVQAAAIIAISMPVSTSYAAAPDPNWHVVKSTIQNRRLCYSRI